MESIGGNLELGTIICKYCDNIIGTLDTEKVAVFYKVCEDSVCVTHQNKEEIVYHDGY